MGWDSEAFCTKFTKASRHPVVSNTESVPKGRSLQSIIYKDLCASEDQAQLAWRQVLHKRAKLFKGWSSRFVLLPFLFFFLLLLFLLLFFLLFLFSFFLFPPCPLSP